MSFLDPTWTGLLYLVAAALFILALMGLNSPRTARRGNLVGAAGAALGVVTVFLSARLDNIPWILGAIAVGTAVAAPVARRVKMTQMPQLVAAFNGVGGGAAALVALLELAHTGDAWVRLAIAFTLLVGAVSFAGSAVTFAKLQELMTTRPVVFRGLPVIMAAVLLAAVGAAVAVVLTGSLPLALALLVLGLAAGVLLVLPVGGADVPIVISLLNAFTGLAVAASGLVLGNVLLLVAGTLVGASGTILTRAMAAAMGRSVAGILFGAFRGGSTAGSTAVSERPVRSSSAEDVAVLLGYAQRVIIVPGYGLAVAQGQHTAAELAKALQLRGIQVDFAIHPVAGRMPGHMNVLLAEANVPYEELKEMTEINSEFKTADVALVVGANDVVNPAAKTSSGSPIFGMPILEVADARQVVFLEALHAAGLRRHRERAALRTADHPAVRRRQGLADARCSARSRPCRREARIRCGTGRVVPAGGWCEADRRARMGVMQLPVMPPIAPMLAKAVSALPDPPDSGPKWSFEPKWDGFRSIIFRDGDEVEIGSRNGKPMTRYFPELVESLKANLPPRCVLDGEIVLVGGSGDRLDFDALQQRIHPAASRVKLLAAQTPASFVAFDLLALDDEDLTGRPFSERRSMLERALAGSSAPDPPDRHHTGQRHRREVVPPVRGSRASTGSWPNPWTAPTSRTNA